MIIMLKNSQTDKVEDRRSPPLFVSKKVCMDACNSVGDGVTYTAINEHHLGKKKSVTFNDEKLVQRFEFDDDDQSRMSRMLYWEFMAVDRARFRDRIERLDGVLSPILATAHRNGIYTRRIEKSTRVASFKSSFVEVEEVDTVVVVSKTGTN